MAMLIPTEDETMLRDAARGFLDDAAPVANLRANRDQGRAFDPDLWAEMVKMGWAGVLVGAAEGGSDMGFAAANILAEEMGRTLVASPFLSSAVIAASALALFAAFWLGRFPITRAQHEARVANRLSRRPPTEENDPINDAVRADPDAHSITP